MNEKTGKLIENTLKDILLGNAILTFIFAMPIFVISKRGLGGIIWILTMLILPAMFAVVAWLLYRIKEHSRIYFHNEMVRGFYVFYVLAVAELLFIYSFVHIIESVVKQL